MIKKLEKNFIGKGEVNGFEFHQIKRSGKSLLYEVYNGKNKHFEIFEIKTTPICLDFEKRVYSEIDFKEIYPKSKDFGTWAYTTNNIDKALEYIDRLEEKLKSHGR